MRIAVFMLLLAAVYGCSASQTGNAAEPVQEEPKELQTAAIFEVTVPKNTPEGDAINILYGAWNEEEQALDAIEIPMEKTGEHTYTASLAADLAEGEFEYIYSRNAWGDITSEYLPLRPEDSEPGNEFEYRNAKRRVALEPGKVQKDAVERWRWFPEGEVIRKSSIEPSSNFRQRASGMEFRSGAGIQDLYIPGFEKFYNTTAEHIVSQGYNWVAVYPPWQWYEEDPPKLGNALELGVGEGPNYPSDAELRRHIKAFKDAGLRVSLEPQICCTSINREDRTDVWLDAYISEVNRFLVHHAQIAEETGAEMFLFDTFGADEARVTEMLHNVKKVYSGDIIVPISPFLYQTDAATQTIPQAHEIPWAANADIFLFLGEGELTPKDNPTDAELKQGAGRNIDLMKPFLEEYDKPVIVRIAPFSIKQAWKGPSHYQKGRIPGESGGEDVWEYHSYSAEDQARTVNAYWQAAAEREWVAGLFNFGYWHWDMPMLPDWSIRGKPAEDAWRKWNEEIHE